MGRFYRTSRGGQLDFMKELPVNMMLKGIEQADLANDQIYQQTDILGNAVAAIKHLPGDNERVQAIQQGYQAELDGLTKQLAADPASYKKQMPMLRQLTRKLSTDMQSGELAAIQGNASKLAEWDKTYSPLVARGDITPDAYQKMKRSFVGNYKGAGYDAATGNYNQMQTEDIYKTQDFNKLIKESVAGIKANAKDSKVESNGGKWLVTNGSKEEWVDGVRIAQIAMDSLMADPNVVGYVKQGAKYGYLNGVADEKGNFINPYTLDKEGRPVFNDRSLFTAPIRAAVGREAFRKSESSSAIQANPYAVAEVNFSNDLKKMAIQDKTAKDKLIFETGIKHANDKELAQMKADLAAGKADAIKAKATKPKAGDAANPMTLTDHGDITLSWRPHAGGKITNETVMKDMVHEKDIAMTNRALANDETLSGDERDMYSAQATAAEFSYKKKAELANIARTDVNAKLLKQGYKEEDLQQLQGIDRKVNNLSKQIEELGAGYKAVSAGVGAPGIAPVNPNQKAINNMTKQLASLKKIQKADNQLMDTWFKDNSEKTAFNFTGIGATAAQQKSILAAIAANPSIFVPKNMGGQEFKDATEKMKGGSGKSNAAAFPEISGDVEKMMKDFEITAINAPVAGMPASITVKSKTKDGFMLNNRTEDQLQNFIIPISGNLVKSLGTDLVNSKNANAKKVGGYLTDFSKAEAISQLEDRLINQEKDGVANPAGSIALPSFNLTQGGQKVSFVPQLVVRPLKDKAQGGEVGVYEAKISTPNGGYKSMGNVASMEDAVNKAFALYNQTEK